MENSDKLKNIVKEKYSVIALQDQDTNASSCCGSGGCSVDVSNIMNDDYKEVEGYEAEADLKLGCGLPTEYAHIKKGDTVVDLGSGAGNDCFIARHEVGETGKVIGVDFTEAMVEKAINNAEKLNYDNVEFVLGDIENIPISSNTADVVVSNCVMNLVPDKPKAFGEVFRILKPKGHFSISDIVVIGDLPEKLKSAAEMYAGCVASAIQKDSYVNIIQEAGFVNFKIQKEKPIIIPNDILGNYLTPEEIELYNSNKNIIYSITVYAEKPAACC